MGGFKRFCMFIFSLSGLLCLAALALTWVGPWTDQASALMTVDEYFITLEVLFCITVLGLLVMLFRSIFSRKVRTIEITTVDGGVISVSRDAIASQAKHIVEADGTCTASRVTVKAKKRGHVRVHVKVLPHESVDVVQKGSQLHEELATGLVAVCGDKLEDVSLEFVVPEEVTSTEADAASQDSGDISVEPSSYVSYPSSDAGEEDDAYSDSMVETLPATDADAQGVPAPQSTGEITVPMGSSRDSASDQSKEA